MEVDDTLSAYFTAEPVKLKANTGKTTTPKAQSVVENDIDRYLNAAGAPRFNKAVLSAPVNSPTTPAATPGDAATTAEVQVKPVVLSNILARMGGGTPATPAVSKRQQYSSSLIGAPAAQTPQGQRNQMIRELRENKSDVTFRPLPQSRRLNAFSQ